MKYEFIRFKIARQIMSFGQVRIEFAAEETYPCGPGHQLDHGLAFGFVGRDEAEFVTVETTETTKVVPVDSDLVPKPAAEPNIDVPQLPKFDPTASVAPVIPLVATVEKPEAQPAPMSEGKAASTAKPTGDGKKRVFKAQNNEPKK